MPIKKASFLKTYFWDIDWADFKPGDYPEFTIERVLEHGDRKATHWLQEHFSTRKIIAVLKHTKRLSIKSANYWRIIYQLKREQLSCLKTSSQQLSNSPWRQLYR